ncbi:MAG TPA: zf-TFIIB domain-containing protein [Kiritimatiellia bacterium]|nr:zf-TFIIB domain-containing protein [Kiritimatiellia bacterium]HMP35505.1 zf-TFIIB domain-containing protein [Kiritimatiellia bacterium]
MNCLRCHTQMRKVVKDHVLVDQCPDCGGIWLDAGELAMLEQGAGLEQAEIMQQARRELLKEAERLVSVVGFCPTCEQEKLHPVKKRGVELDVCRHCGGLFLDAGELEQMLEGEQKQGFFASVLVLIRG